MRAIDKKDKQAANQVPNPAPYQVVRQFIAQVLKKQDLPITTLLFLFFFLIIAIFQMLKPLKGGLFVQHYGADLELYAKMGNIFVAVFGVMVFTTLYKKLQRQQMIYVLSLFFMGAFLLMPLALREPGPITIWGFYFLVDMEAAMMVAAFWAYLTDIANTHQAKRLFGPIGVGGVLGGWFGISVAKLFLEKLGAEGLLVLSAAFMGIIILVIFATERFIRRSHEFRPTAVSLIVPAPSEPDTKRYGILDGARLVLKSNYLLAVVAIVVSYEIASQLMDYQFKLVAEGFSNVQETQAFFTNIYFYANMLSVVAQLFLVSIVMRKFGLGTALLILPLAIVVSSLGFLVTEALLAISLMVIFDNGLNYSVQQTARESLFVVTSSEEKYIARAFINIFVQRLAKGISILLALGMGTLGINTSSLSLLAIAAMIVMAMAGVYAGRCFARKNKEENQNFQLTFTMTERASQTYTPAAVVL